jgi:prepilin-type N-terminal cleavage/methylation domain-containing protein
MILPQTERVARRVAFTLVEVLVVVSIILVLAAIAVPITLSVLDSSKRDIARAQCKGLLTQAVKSYQLDSEINPEENLPTSWNDVLQSPKAALKPDSLRDPWGREYKLVVPSQRNNVDGFDIYSDCGGGGEPVGNW